MTMMTRTTKFYDLVLLTSKTKRGFILIFMVKCTQIIKLEMRFLLFFTSIHVSTDTDNRVPKLNNHSASVIHEIHAMDRLEYQSILHVLSYWSIYICNSSPSTV
jgi:hypothetical protein